MPPELRDELKEFERELAHVIARFIKLYERIEREARPETAAKEKPPEPIPLQPLFGYH